MPTTNYNINVSVDGGDKSGSSKTKINRKVETKNIEKASSFNLKNIAKVGVAFSGLQAGSELVGAYTENRLRQRKFKVGLTFAKYGAGIALNAPAGIAYMAGDLAYRNAMYSIEIQKGNRKADYFKRISGNNSFSGSRYRGDYA